MTDAERIAYLEKQIQNMIDWWNGTVALRVKPEARETFSNGQWGLLCIDLAGKKSGPKIIEPGDLKATVIRFKCDKCGCVFETDCSDYVAKGYSYDDFTKEYSPKYNCRCPTCNSLCVNV